MSRKHFTLYSYATGPNGWKVTYLLNELGLDYETKFLNTKEEYKSPEYLKLNPNGRLPTLVDHKNNDYTVWESAAILLYLVDKYDTKKKHTVTKDKDKYHIYQWLFFQMSGQGPYFGQGFWFTYLHSEKIPSAQLQYQNEARRILSVLESVLSKQEWLVAGKVTIADIAFVLWNNIINVLLGADVSFEKEFPATFKWHSKLIEIPGVKAGIAEKAFL
ncbi:hypothetical protein EUX98_g8394 [Antrodiella citrinella]|uniref:glutathione transferase n=1 Tax=Antrodiella citrinella TaxID=2447956 RepID=A0A4S4M841_9APHY|nr:hypothetical protein EUX98_g8394 [Antrodiella citrinella]